MDYGRNGLALVNVVFTDTVLAQVPDLYGAHRECGIVVDSVRDVVDIAADGVRPAPTMHGCEANEFIEGITTLGEQMLILLDADRLVSGELSPLALTAAA